MIKKSTDFLLQWQDYLALMILVIASLAVMFFGNDSVTIGRHQRIVLEFLALVEQPVDQLSGLLSAKESYNQLLKQNADLLVQNSRFEEAYLENLRLRGMLQFVSEVAPECQPARVMGKSGYESIGTIIIDRGSEEGVKENQPIISTAGLVGKIIKVYKQYSVGQLIIDRNFRAGARIRRSRVEGIAKWAGNDLGMLAEVHKRADVKIGDVIVTSENSALFLAGIKIGIVVDIKSHDSSMFKEVYFKPSVDFTKLEEVLIVTTKNNMNLDQLYKGDKTTEN